MSQVDIIIPTYMNPEYVSSCVHSIFMNTNFKDYRVIVVNNAEPGHCSWAPKDDRLIILQQEKNLGWEGGLKAGISVSSSPYVLFLNDDTFIPSHQRDWMTKMLSHFADPSVACVGPTSNVVMGRQQMFYNVGEETIESKFLIGFCVMVRRSDYDAIGGVDCELPGGDDLDLGIRFRKVGKRLIIDRDVFVWHHGFKTGEKVHGSDWNSLSMIERTNFYLMRKHGIREFLGLWKN